MSNKDNGQVNDTVCYKRISAVEKKYIRVRGIKNGGNYISYKSSL